MNIDWSGEKTLVKEDAEVLKECISCPNVNTCSKELKQGEIFCLSLYAKFTDDLKVKKRLENLLNEKEGYICIKGFSLEKCDDDGFTIEGEYTTIEEGTDWYIPEDEDYRLIGGEIRLESDDYGWIEISKETLEEHFKAIS